LPLPVHQAFPEVTKRALKQLQEFTAACKAAGKRVAVWGAGGKGISAIAIGRLSGIAYVIDSDPFKQGLFTPVSHLPVVSPAHLAEDPVDAIILTALAYKQEILAELRGKMSFAGEIAILAEELEVLRA
jgi:D-arabinose 1-dehydrogenase-like Zn-dependent alcohol dehydrogenase